ncbi:MAG: hypothetical protein ACJA2S_003158 [Cyclobacteriaceae bacterium]|jgi:hypothetical protein
MKITRILLLPFFYFCTIFQYAQCQTSPDQINFVRKGVKRLIFEPDQSISLARINPSKIIGLSVMHPIKHHTANSSNINISKGELIVESTSNTQTSIWLGGMNPFATYSMDISSTRGEGAVGFEFNNPTRGTQFIVSIEFQNKQIIGARLKVIKDSKLMTDQSIVTNIEETINPEGRLILQMLGSGFVLYHQKEGLPIAIAQNDFNKYLDLREKKYIHSLQASIYIGLNNAKIHIKKVEAALTTGIGLADIRAITYENGDPYLDQDRLWYTMSIRGRALPHHIQGVFSMNPSVFDVKLEGIILFDRNDGLLRNEIASHIYFDRNEKIWRGLTTGFSAFANPKKEKKQLLAIESKKDPRFGFSVMKAEPFGMIGDIEDPHILFDEAVGKWRMLTCENQTSGYKAVVLESKNWNKGYTKIAGPVAHNSTGTSIQKIGGQRFCFSGSSEREIFIYSYPDLKEVGTLKMDLPPWDDSSRTRVWPNVVQLPEGYPFRYVALMMDRFNYPGLKGPHWTYGGIYLYHGSE